MKGKIKTLSNKRNRRESVAIKPAVWGLWGERKWYQTETQISGKSQHERKTLKHFILLIFFKKCNCIKQKVYAVGL